MKVHFSYKAQKTPEIEREVEQQTQKLERRLLVFRPELVHLHGTIDRGARQGATCILNLRLPSGQLTSSDEGDSASAAVKTAFSGLFRELNKHKELLRNQHKWRRDRGSEVGDSRNMAGPNINSANDRQPKQPVPLLAAGPEDPISAETFENGERATAGQVREYINANLSRLERFIEREIRSRQDNGQIAANALSKDEVLDEVIVDALSAEERPENLTVERWLFRLAVHAIRRVSRENTEHIADGSAVRLEAPAGRQNVSGSDDAQLQFDHPDEFVSRQDQIPSSEQGTPEEIAARDEMIGELDLALRGAHPADRESLMLFAIEGFSVDEIAQITGRRGEEVKRSIATARGGLAQKLPASNLFKKRLLNETGAA